MIAIYIPWFTVDIFLYLLEQNLKLAAFMNVQWIGSENDNVLPLKELCLQEVGMFFDMHVTVHICGFI